MAKIDVHKLKFRIHGISIEEDREFQYKHESRIFGAYYYGKLVGHVNVGRYADFGKTAHANNSIFADSNFSPPRVIPYVQHSEVEPEFRGNGICAMIKRFANDFYKTKYGMPLHSGITITPEAARTWQKLVEEGKAVEYQYCLGGDPPEYIARWKML